MLSKNGILVDGRLRTSVPDIYAAGDVAALPNPQTGDYQTRPEWYSAVTQGKIAAAMMVGHTEVAQELFGAHWQATQLGKLLMLTVGNPLGANTNEQTAIYTDISGGGYRRLATVDDRLIGYLSVGTTRPDGLSIKRLIDEGISIRHIFKSLLKGNIDTHEYLTRVKTHTAKTMATQPLLTSRHSQALRWSEGGYSNPSIQIPPAARQKDTIDLNMQIQQATREDAVYQSRPSHLNGEVGSASPTLRGQFARFGLTTTRDNKSGNEGVTTLPYVQSGQERMTDPLLASFREDNTQAAALLLPTFSN